MERETRKKYTTQEIIRGSIIALQQSVHTLAEIAQKLLIHR